MIPTHLRPPLRLGARSVSGAGVLVRRHRSRTVTLSPSRRVAPAAAAATGGGTTPAGSGAGTPAPRIVAAAVAAFLAAEPGAGADVTARPWRRMQERG